jgi:hypothetical protein
MPRPLKLDWELGKALALQGFTQAEIADKLGCKLGTVSQHAHRHKWSELIAKTRENVTKLVSERVGESMAQKGAKHRERVFEEVEKSLETIAKLKPAKKRSEILQHEEILKLHANTFMKVTGLDQPNVGTFNVAFTMNVQEVQLPSEQTAEKQAQVVDIEASKTEIEDRQ